MLALLVLASLPGTPRAAAQAGVPLAGELPVALPEDVGVDSRRLVALSEWIRAEQHDIRSLLIVRDGSLIFERYSAGMSREANLPIYSVTKSVLSTLAGILVDAGAVSLDSTARDVLLPTRPDLSALLDSHADVCLRHALTMSSGFDWIESPTDTPLYAAADRLTVALGPAALAEPGERFNYSNADMEIAGAMIAAAGGSRDLFSLGTARLFAPLGMRNVEWQWADGSGREPGGYGLRMRAVDMARFGLLYLGRGEWDGTRILSESWIDYATTPEVGELYGAGWWVGTYPCGGERACFVADGYKGQFVIVLPARRAVVVIQAVLPFDAQEAIAQELMHDYVLPALRGRRRIHGSAARAAALDAELALALASHGLTAPEGTAEDEPRYAASTGVRVPAPTPAAPTVPVAPVVPLAPGTTSVGGFSGAPLDCGLTVPTYGTIALGTSVTLGSHLPGWTGPDGHGGYVTGDTYWNDAMWSYVGQRTVVTALAGLDPAGCPVVRTAADGGAWVWRVRNLGP